MIVGFKNTANLFHLYSGRKNEMTRLEQVYLEDQFHPLETPLEPLSNLLAIPLQKEKDAQKRVQKRKQSNNTMLKYLYLKCYW